MPDLSDEAETLAVAKARLRAAVLGRRRKLTASALADAAARVQAELASVVRRGAPRLVCGYVPIAGEPGGSNLPDVLVRAVAGSAEVLLPVLREDLDLDWGRYAGPSSLTLTTRRLREPVGARLGVDAVREADLVVVPAVAVDRRGVRLGRGGGSYDRVLARVGNAYTVALLHEGEVVDAVPAQPHDAAVRAAITPAELVEF